jgi:hypothetical protein
MGLSISGYNIYGSDRAFLLSLLPFSMLLVILFNTNFELKKLLFMRCVIVVFIILSLIIFPIISHANDPYNFVSESELRGSEFGFEMVIQTTNRSHYHNALAYPVSEAYYTHRYNRAEMLSQKGKEYKNKCYKKGSNILYNSGQLKIIKI